MKFVFNPLTGKLDYVLNTAAELPVADAGGYYSGGNVEAVLQEIGALGILTIPLTPDIGGTGVANAAGSTLTLGAATSITGGGTVALGGFTLTLPESMTVAGRDVSNTFTAAQTIDGSADAVQLTIDANATQTNDILQIRKSDGTVFAGADERGILFSDGGTNVSNLFVGASAGNAGTAGVQNVYLGRFAGSSSASSNCVGIGDQSMSFVTGNNNTCVGYRAGLGLRGGDRNFCLGSDSGLALNNGVRNVLIGTSSGIVLTGSNNIAIGDAAGGSMVGVTGNTLMGDQAGISVTSSYNIFLGYRAGSKQTATGNLLIIDNTQRADAATEQTHSIIYGVMGANPEDQSLRFNADTFSFGTDADSDVVVNFLANSNSGVLTWMEDEDYFKYDDSILFPDSEPLYFGTGVDMSVDYDGSQGNIKTDLVAASDLHIDCGTDKTIVLDEVVYEDLQVSISNIRVPVANAPTERLYDGGTGGVTFPFLGFAVDDYLYFDVQTTHATKLNTVIDNHIHFSLPNTTNIGDKFQFQLDVMAAGINTAWAVPASSPFTSEHTIVANDNTYHRLLEVADIDASNDTVSSVYKCKLTRIDATSNEYGSEVYVTFADCHYQKDTMGSRQEGTK